MMSSKDAQGRLRHFYLQSQQRRLRHLRSILARNIKPKSGLGQSSHKDSLLDTHFTLHCGQGQPEFYKSETVRHSLNPTWRSFDLTAIKNVDTTSTNLIVRCWCECCGEKNLLIEWNVDLTGLVFLGEHAIMKRDGKSHPPNSIIFGLRDGYYGAQVNVQENKWLEVCKRLRVIRVSSDSVVPMYTESSLSRLHTIQKAIQQTSKQVHTVRESIHQILVKTTDKDSKQTEEESLELKLRLLKEELEKQRAALKEESEEEAKLKSKIKRKATDIKKLRETLRQSKFTLQQNQKLYVEKRELLVKVNAQLLYRRKQLISELLYIYPVHKRKEGYSICGAKLPNSEEFVGVDEECISFALGNVAHVVIIIANFINIPLRYPIVMFGSRSMIQDLVKEVRDKEFPLFIKGREKYQFHYAVYLLNKNIAQLRHHCGIPTADLRQTLPNLRELLDAFSGDRLSISSRGGSPTSPPLQIASTEKLALTRSVSHQVPRKLPPEIRERSPSVDNGLPVVNKSSAVHKFIGIRKKKVPVSVTQTKLANNSPLRTDALEDSLIIAVDEANGNIMMIDPDQDVKPAEQDIEMQGIDNWPLPNTPEFIPDGSLSSRDPRQDDSVTVNTKTRTQETEVDDNVCNESESYDFLM